MSPSERPEDSEAYVREQPEVISLEPYQEIRGRLDAVISDARFIYIELSSGTLRFELDSPEAKICRSTLDGNEGEFISILQTDDPINRILVKVDSPITKRTLSDWSTS